MRCEFVYTKQRLMILMRSLLDEDVLGSDAYGTVDRAEEGFEKRAALEFVLWFLDQAIPETFSFRHEFEDLEAEYPDAVARRIAEGGGWVGRQARERAAADNVVFIDFTDRT